MRRWMRAGVVALALVLTMGAVLADDQPKPEQLKQMYDEALASLKSAQERKNQLAAENEQLKAKVAELQKQLDATQAEEQVRKATRGR